MTSSNPFTCLYLWEGLTSLVDLNNHSYVTHLPLAYLTIYIHDRSTTHRSESEDSCPEHELSDGLRKGAIFVSLIGFCL